MGESSQLKVIKCKIEDVSFGVVSKECPLPKSGDTETKNAKIAAFAAFQKKDSFGPALIKISGSQTIGCQKLALIQEGSKASIDGEIIETVSFRPVIFIRLNKWNLLINQPLKKNWN